MVLWRKEHKYIFPLSYAINAGKHSLSSLHLAKIYAEYWMLCNSGCQGADLTECCTDLFTFILVIKVFSILRQNMLIKGRFAFQNIDLLLIVVCRIIQGDTLLIFPVEKFSSGSTSCESSGSTLRESMNGAGWVSEAEEHNVLINKSSKVNDKYVVSNCPWERHIARTT